MTTECACGKPTGGDTYLCPDCTTGVHESLAGTPSLVVDLELTMTRQRRFGDPAAMGRTHNDVLPFNPGAATILRDLHTELASAVRMYRLTQPATPPGDHPAAMSGWLLARLPHMVGLPWAPTLLRITHVTTRGQRIIDSPPDRTYAGPCGTCGTDLYAKPEEAHATCHDCGVTYDLATRRAWLLDVVDDQLATATEIARALTTLHTPVTAERIRQWKRRNRVTVRGTDRRGDPLFRVGDVVDLLVEYAEKQADKKGA